MAYCSRCGVEVAEGAKRCPLCKAMIFEFDEEGNPISSLPQGRYPEDQKDGDPIAQLSEKERGKLMWETATVSSGLAIVIVILINLMSTRVISWSFYPTISLVFAWLCYSMPRFLKNPWLVLSVLGPSLIAFVFLFDVFDGVVSWFLPLGLPITLIFIVSAIVSALFTATAKKKGINIAAFVLIGLTMLCVGIDLVLQLYRTGYIGITWSIIVGLALLPVCAFLLYIHHRITKRLDFKRIFHV